MRFACAKNNTRILPNYPVHTARRTLQKMLAQRIAFIKRLKLVDFFLPGSRARTASSALLLFVFPEVLFPILFHCVCIEYVFFLPFYLITTYAKLFRLHAENKMIENEPSQTTGGCRRPKLNGVHFSHHSQDFGPYFLGFEKLTTTRGTWGLYRAPESERWAARKLSYTNNIITWERKCLCFRQTSTTLLNINKSLALANSNNELFTRIFEA